MTQTEPQPRSGVLTVLFAFAGGALVGGAAALLFAPRSGAETRRRIGGVVDDTRGFAGRMPQALREASAAAQAAFSASLKESGGANGAVSRAAGKGQHRGHA